MRAAFAWTGAAKRRKRWEEPLARKLFNCKWLYLMLLPCLANFVIFHYWPMYGLQIAFKRFNIVLGAGASPWIGLEHFVNFFSSYYFWEVMGNTLRISLLSIVIGFPFPIFFALVLNEVQNHRAKRYFKRFLICLISCRQWSSSAWCKFCWKTGELSIRSCRALAANPSIFWANRGISSQFISYGLVALDWL